MSVLPFRSKPAQPSLFVDDVFDAVASLPASERDDALRQRCAGHPSVETEVRALLDAVSDSDTDDVPTPAELAHGVRLGRYRLEEELGTGATASVWKAFDEQLRSWTALKLLHPHVHATHALDAVMTEARAASRIISDHVVRIKSAGRFGSLHYIDMALCAEHSPDENGQEVLTIGSTLADTPLQSIDEICRVIAEAALGVDAAHRTGVLHRDLKPANILLLPVSRRALVTDFGLAAPQLAPLATANTAPTETVTVAFKNGDGKLVGTPCFMPPEQAWGQPLRRASDVYGLGATLYSLLCGQAPYQSKDLPHRAALETVLRVREEAPVDVRVVEPRLPKRLARIVRKAMAREAGDRYGTAAELAADLQAYRQRRPTTTDHGRPWVHSALFLERHKTAVITGVVLFSLLIAMLTGATWMAWERTKLQEAVVVADTQRQESALQANAAIELERKAQSQREAALALSADAQRDAKRAREGRESALRSESDAERRFAIERGAREVAEIAMEEAHLRVTATEAERLAAEQSREAIQQVLEQTQTERDIAMRDRDGAQEARATTEAELRQAHLDLVAAEAQVEATQAAQNAANERLMWLERALSDMTAQRDEAQQAPAPQTPAPTAPEPTAPAPAAVIQPELPLAIPGVPTE